MLLYITADTVSPYVVAYEDILKGPVQQFLKHSNTIGGDVKTQVLFINKLELSKRILDPFHYGEIIIFKKYMYLLKIVYWSLMKTKNKQIQFE
jgi:hypothetical protein